MPNYSVSIKTIPIKIFRAYTSHFWIGAKKKINTIPIIFGILKLTRKQAARNVNVYDQKELA
jgi:hypothetical protein